MMGELNIPAPSPSPWPNYSLPPEYSTLTNLRKLTISSQHSITGIIPKEYSALVQLVRLFV